MELTCPGFTALVGPELEHPREPEIGTIITEVVCRGGDRDEGIESRHSHLLHKCRHESAIRPLKCSAD